MVRRHGTSRHSAPALRTLEHGAAAACARPRNAEQFQPDCHRARFRSTQNKYNCLILSGCLIFFLSTKWKVAMSNSRFSCVKPIATCRSRYQKMCRVYLFILHLDTFSMSLVCLCDFAYWSYWSLSDCSVGKQPVNAHSCGTRWRDSILTLAYAQSLLPLRT